MRNAVSLCLFLTAAAVLEVWGDATIRKWAQEGRHIAFACLGGVMLAAYGIVVNKVPWDLAKLLGIYVVFFAVAGVLWGRFVRNETVAWTTWCGLAFIVCGGLIVQWGPRWFGSR